ncbi:MAG: DNA internalization-related competence protein ComEC/Rec2, partial [Gammaproteobacteria bacterium]
HITLAAALGALFGRLLSCCVPMLLPYIHAGWLAAAGGVLAAVGAVLLAGGGIAILRALLMAVPALLLRALGFRASLLRSLLVALWLLLLVDAPAVLGSGLWFSAGAVLVLALLPRRHRPASEAEQIPKRTVIRDGCFTLLRAETALTVVLGPLQVALAGSWPTAGLPANLLAVPVMTLIVTPLVLLAAVLYAPLPDVAGVALACADWAFDRLAAVLAALAHGPEFAGAPDAWRLALGLVGGLGLLLTHRWQHRAMLTLAASVVLMPGGQRSERAVIGVGEFRVTAIDVGQGDAILVDTAWHRLLFDTGPGFPDGRDRVMTHIMPVLAATGRTALDRVILSHADLDHTGGAVTFRHRGEVADWLGTAPQASLSRPTPSSARRAPQQSDCHAREWQWDGVTFRTEARIGASPAHRLATATRIEPGSNDDSCVLAIGNGRVRVLLPGDIGERVEMALLGVLHGPFDLVLAPHHGSRSSSSRAFMRRLQARTVWISAGHGNRYGHPHPEVCGRYRVQGARVFVTAVAGALTWRSDQPLDTRSVRSGHGPYWRSRPSSAGDCGLGGN